MKSEISSEPLYGDLKAVISVKKGIENPLYITPDSCLRGNDGMRSLYFCLNSSILSMALLIICLSLVQACGSDEETVSDGDMDSEASTELDLSDGETDLSENDNETLSGENDSEIESSGEVDVEFITEDEAEQEIVPLKLKVMSFNLRLGVAPDGDNRWEIRKSIVYNFLNGETPDVFGIQEGWEFQLEDIVAAVPGYAYVGISRNNNSLDEYSAIFYKTSRFATGEGGTFWLSDTPDEPGTKFSEQQCCVRICTWVQLFDSESGQEFYAFNTHYDYVAADDVQVRSSALIATRMAEIAGDKPHFLTGDFNVPAGSDAWLILTGEMQYNGAGAELIDPWMELGLSEEGTFHQFTGTATSDDRIDWILHSAHFSALAAEVEHYSENGFYPSDHFPVSAEIEINVE